MPILFLVVLLSFVEGLTEFLPISSTGHLILVSALFGLNEDNFVQSFNIIIQFGAIASVLWAYRTRFFPIRPLFYRNVFVAFLPAAVFGFLLKSKIESLLGSVQVVAWALIIGGVVLILMDRKWGNKPATLSLERMTPRQSLLLGLFQCLALIPGVSRAGASILGGMGVGLSRQEATEFSFFLAVPTLTAAAAYKTFKIAPNLDSSHFLYLALGIFLSFFFALLAIRFFISIVQRFGFEGFGWYRILLGIAVLLYSSFYLSISR